MAKYIIEGGINFYDELYKSFNDSDLDTELSQNTEICQITGMPLIERSVTLECNHKFNYSALYKEIFKQKYIFRTYNIEILTQTELIKLKAQKSDYFIKCPYCRCIQFTLLPYYEDMEHEKRYGINSLEKTQYDYNFEVKMTPHNYTYMSYGYTFNNGHCCKVMDHVGGVDIYCKSTMSAPVLDMNKSFCYMHIRSEVKKYKMAKIKQEREDLKNQKLKEKEDLKAEKLKAREEIKEQKLKQKNNKKKQSENVVSKQEPIQAYNPNDELLVTDNVVTDNVVTSGCQTIIKIGPRKGQMCGNKLKTDNCCLRHSK
jgi:hypothetical protein